MNLKIWDCFLFFNELDLLEIRLNSLAPWVERFVLCESPFTHSGNEKPLYFLENKERFRNFKITYLCTNLNGGGPWDRENQQRNFLINGIKDVPEDSIILLSDVDEIPDLARYEGQEGVFKQSLYYYAVNVFTGAKNWRGTIACRKKNIVTMQELRNRRNKMAPVSKCGGWHFSTLGTPEQIRRKIEAFAHQELNNDEKKGKIAENRRNLVDPYNRNAAKFTVQMPAGPQWLLDHRDRYRHLFYES